MTDSTAVWLRDAAERIAATFAIVFLTAWLASGPVLDLSLGALKSAALAGLAAALTALKTMLARSVGNPDSASLDPRG